MVGRTEFMVISLIAVMICCSISVFAYILTGVKDKPSRSGGTPPPSTSNPSGSSTSTPPTSNPSGSSTSTPPTSNPLGSSTSTPPTSTPSSPSPTSTPPTSSNLPKFKLPKGSYKLDIGKDSGTPQGWCIWKERDFCGPIAENVQIKQNDDNSYDLRIGDKRKCDMFGGSYRWGCKDVESWHLVGSRKPGKFYIDGDFANTIRDSDDMPIFIARLLYKDGEYKSDIGEFKFKPLFMKLE